MNTIAAIREVDADGTIHLPLPEELRHGKMEVTATLRAVGDSSPSMGADKVLRRKAALQALRELGGLRNAISDPTAWQNELRPDRTLPGRD